MTQYSQAWAPAIPGAHARFTTVADGNLARHVGDDPTRVEHNRARISAEFAMPVLFVNQVHSPEVVTISTADDVEAVHATPPSADALVTTRKDVALAIMVADCMPILLSDPQAGVIGAAHAGRRGLLDGVIDATLEAMRAQGAEAPRITAVIGPSICGACYEVPEQMRTQALEKNPAVGARTSWHTPALDLTQGARYALTQAGVRATHIHTLGACTRESTEFFSFRRDPHTGRFAGIISRENYPDGHE